MMNNPWKNLPETAPFILDEEKALVAAYNATAKPEHKLHTDLMPAPYTGGLDSARIVFLSLNPGYEPLDEYRTEEHRQEVRKNLMDPYGYDDFIFLNKKFSTVNVNGEIKEDAGYKWWYSRTHELIEECGAIRGRFMALEWFPYASKKFKAPKKIFPSQAFTFELLREAMRRGLPIVIFRHKKDWVKHVPELATYPNVMELSSPQCGCVSKKNIKDGRFSEIVKIMKGEL